MAVASIGVLAWIRTATGAEFAFASLALLPVMLIAWVAGRNAGVGMALLACAAWVIGDIASAKHAWTSWVPWTNGAIRLVTYSLVAILAAKVHDQFVIEHERAARDELTGLANRRHFIEAANIEIQRSRRYAHPLAVVCLDLDHFKQLNDNHGHALGDEALRATATALHGMARSSDLVARMGGDEFVILLPEVDRSAATEVAQRLSAAVNAALARFPGVSASVGAAWFGDRALTLAAMLGAADAAMYRAKQQRNGFVVVEDRSASPSQSECESRQGGKAGQR
jgi:diguanylate cyclase (GGDEF)-like protein